LYGYAENKLPRAASPEAAGVSSDAVEQMLAEIVSSGVNEHGLMIVRGGRVAAESFRFPYAADRPHIMYSSSKPVTATAVGFAVDEGLLTLDTKVLDIFPDYRPRKRDEKLETLTVRHLITMQSGKKPSILANKTKDNWLQSYFDAPFEFAPGAGFDYVNENCYVLCAIVSRVAGMSVTEYLTPRLWEPLGIPVPFWETDPRGIEVGGWGIFMSAESLAKFGLCYLNAGMFQGRQVIPEWFAREAVKNHKPLINGGEPDFEPGYGYCIWRSGPGNSYRFEGMFGQICFVFEKHDALVVVIAGEMNTGRIHDYVWNHFPNGFIDADETVKPREGLGEKLAGRHIDALPVRARSPLEKTIEGKTIRFRNSLLLKAFGFPMSVLTLAATYMTRDRAGNINDVRLTFGADTCSMTWTEGDETNTVLCGMDGKHRETPITLAGTKYTAFCSASWKDQNTLEVEITPVESISSRVLEFAFHRRKVRMTPSGIPSVKVMIDGISAGTDTQFKNKYFIAFARKTLEIVKIIIEPVHKGRLKK